MRLYFDLERTDPLHAALCDVACKDDNIVSADTSLSPSLQTVTGGSIF
jgi:hypothetical protein